MIGTAVGARYATSTRTRLPALPRPDTRTDRRSGSSPLDERAGGQGGARGRVGCRGAGSLTRGMGDQHHIARHQTDLEDGEEQEHHHRQEQGELHRRLTAIAPAPLRRHDT